LDYLITGAVILMLVKNHKVLPKTDLSPHNHQTQSIHKTFMT